MDLSRIGEIFKTAWTILSVLLLMFGAVYWTVKMKLKDDFCTKADCKAKHDTLDNNMNAFRDNNSSELKEIKDLVKEIRGWVFDLINRVK